jgi:hypothetical protein
MVRLPRSGNRGRRTQPGGSSGSAWPRRETGDSRGREPELVSPNGARVVIQLVPTPVQVPVDPLPETRAERPAWCPEDIVDEWGADSFPASDPPSNW